MVESRKSTLTHPFANFKRKNTKKSVHPYITIHRYTYIYINPRTLSHHHLAAAITPPPIIFPTPHTELYRSIQQPAHHHAHPKAIMNLNKKTADPMIYGFKKLRGKDSNLRPTGYEPVELPLLHPATTRQHYIELSVMCQGASPKNHKTQISQFDKGSGVTIAVDSGIGVKLGSGCKAIPWSSVSSMMPSSRAHSSAAASEVA